MPAFVTSSKNTTPALADGSAVAVTIFPTVAGDDLVVVLQAGDDPTDIPIPVVSSVTASGAVFGPIPDSSIYTGTGTRTAHVELYRAANVNAGITLVTATFATPGTYGVEVGEYSSVLSIGHVDVTSGATGAPSIGLQTQDTNNLVVAGFVAEDTAGSTFTGATVGNARELVYVLGNGAPDVPGALFDNTSATPAVVTNTVASATQSLWAATAVELRSTIGSGFRSFSSLWFGPEGSTFAPGAVVAGFRSFASVWFGPDAGGVGGGVVPPTVTSGRKLISHGLAATIHGELT